MRASRIILRDGTKKESTGAARPAPAEKSQAGAANIEAGAATWRARRAQATRPAARLSAGSGAGARARRVLERGLCGNLARRPVGGDRHEPAEPLWRLRRQARALHQEL